MSEGFIFIVVEYMDCGCLTNMLLESETNYPERMCQYVLYKTLIGIKFLHDRNIIHRDIKSKNILFDSSGEIKLSDISTAAQLT